MSGICILVPWDHKVLLRVCNAFEVKIEGKEVEYTWQKPVLCEKNKEDNIWNRVSPVDLHKPDTIC